VRPAQALALALAAASLAAPAAPLESDPARPIPQTTGAPKEMKPGAPQEPKPSATRTAVAEGKSPVRFEDVTARAGIHFVHNSGRAGKKYLPETLGSGVALFDADGDGWLDILFINGKDWPSQPPKPGHVSLPALYLNNHDGTFRDATRGSGLDVEIYGLGVAAADYDNDGREDVYITALGGDRLFHNEGNGHFRDVTRESGIANASFGTSAAWLDYDRDGKLDLFVANYVRWSADKDIWCSLDGQTKSYCTPESYPGTSVKLFHNLGGGKFEDVTEKAGLADPHSKSLGVAVLDANGDGWPDLFVANDTQPNKLYLNQQNGTFVERGLESGVAFGEDGVARGAMGVDAADYDGTGRPHLLVGNFSNEMLSLYHNEGNGVFVDEAPRSAVGRASLLTLTFGAFFFDDDLDGRLDLFAANGHIEEEIARVQPRIQYQEPPLLFQNVGGGKFEPVTASAGLDHPMVARGAAYGDLFHTGSLDLVVTENHGPAHVWRNLGGTGNHWLRVQLRGTKSNRDGLGAVVRVTTPAGKQWTLVRTGSSYCSQSEIAPTFGLGKETQVTLEIEWPSGTKQRFAGVKVDGAVLVDEDRGIVTK
jgi:hypothetical protein